MPVLVSEEDRLKRMDTTYCRENSKCSVQSMRFTIVENYQKIVFRGTLQGISFYDTYIRVNSFPLHQKYVQFRTKSKYLHVAIIEINFALHT